MLENCPPTIQQGYHYSFHPVYSPARVRVVLIGLSWSVHVMTVPFNMASGVAVTLRVDVKSNIIGVGVDMLEMRVAVKIPRSVSIPTGSFPRYLISSLNAGLFHSRMKPPVTVHVRVTSSPGQTALWALEVSVTTPPAYGKHTVILSLIKFAYNEVLTVESRIATVNVSSDSH